MPVTSSGAISIQNIMTELGISGSTSLNDADVRGLIDKVAGAQMSMSEWYGAQDAFEFTVSSIYTTPQDVQTLATASGWDGTVPIIMNISSSAGFHSNNNSTAALNINVDSTTIINSGYVAGDGGKSGQAGGDAIIVNANGASITNNSGAFLAGGGGSGGGPTAQAGGGAGQSTIGQASANGVSSHAASIGPNCHGTVSTTFGQGGNQGGGGSAAGIYQEMSCTSGSNAGGHGFTTSTPKPANGGSILNAASNTDGTDSGTGYGGGGWGRSGRGGGAAGGKAVNFNGRSVTVTNNGTVYGNTL